MIEPIMFFGIGFLVASLFGLVLIPLVHNRAVRLTMRRLEAATPLSMAEIQADKDQLRAEFAMSTRRLELSVEQMKAKTTSQLAELGKKTDAINRLKVELGEKTAAIFSLEAREKSLKDQLQATEAEHSVKIGALREAERMLSDKQAELAKVSADLGERSATADSQRVEATALRVQVEALKERVSDHEREAQEIGDRLDARAQGRRRRHRRAQRRARQGGEAERPGHGARTRAGGADHRSRGARPARSGAGRPAWPTRRKTLSEREFEISQLTTRSAAAQKTEGRSARRARQRRQPQPRRHRGPRQGKGADRGSARPVEGRARQAAAGNRHHEARGRADLGGRAGGERAAARAHQRHRSRNRAPDRRARRQPIRRSRRCWPASAAGANGPRAANGERKAAAGWPRARAISPTASAPCN